MLSVRCIRSGWGWSTRPHTAHQHRRPTRSVLRCNQREDKVLHVFPYVEPYATYLVLSLGGGVGGGDAIMHRLHGRRVTEAERASKEWLLKWLTR